MSSGVDALTYALAELDDPVIAELVLGNGRATNGRAPPQQRERQLYSLSVLEKIGNFVEELGVKRSGVE